MKVLDTLNLIIEIYEFDVKVSKNETFQYDDLYKNGWNFIGNWVKKKRHVKLFENRKEFSVRGKELFLSSLINLKVLIKGVEHTFKYAQEVRKEADWRLGKIKDKTKTIKGISFNLKTKCFVEDSVSKGNVEDFKAEKSRMEYANLFEGLENLLQRFEQRVYFTLGELLVVKDFKVRGLKNYLSSGLYPGVDADLQNLTKREKHLIKGIGYVIQYYQRLGPDLSYLKKFMLENPELSDKVKELTLDKLGDEEDFDLTEECDLLKSILNTFLGNMVEMLDDGYNDMCLFQK